MVPFKHRLKVDFDDETGNVTLELFTTAEVAGQKVNNSKTLNLDDCSSLCSFLKEIVDSVRETTEEECKGKSIQHVAAMVAHANSTKKKGEVLEGENGIKRIQLKGTLSPKSGLKTSK